MYFATTQAASSRRKGVSGMSAAPAAQLVDWADTPATRLLRVLQSRLITFCVIELYRIRPDQSEIYTRAIQPALWLLIFGETFTRLRAIPTGSLPYLDYMAPGIIAQSGLFIAIFYGIMLIWERDAGILSKLLATPTPRVALVAGKAFAAGIRAAGPAVVVVALSAVLRRGGRRNPPRPPSARLVVVGASALFS